MEWRNYHIYYTDIDRLLLECVAPFLRTLNRRLEIYFWERHYAGGPHLRVRFYGPAGSLDPVCQEFLSAVENYLKLFPSHPITTYSRDDARQMLEMEGESWDPGDLEYRVNAIIPCPYLRLQSRFVEGEGLRLLHGFLRDSNPLTETMLKDPTTKLEQLLRLYFLNALVIRDDLVQGSVSFKSHWSGFAAGFPIRPAIERIRRSFDEQKARIISTMLDVQEAYTRRDFSNDPMLEKWLGLFERYGTEARTLLLNGAQISSTMTKHEVSKYRESLKEHGQEENEFMQTLLSDERFVAAFSHEQTLAWPRVLINLLYMIIPALGLTVLDKMALCYFAHRAVEIHFECDLTDVLRNNISAVLKSHPPSTAQR
ncbi:MAG TPA: lantibiotic dehydratase C-terminal domain-containing protein [Candidatus Angelobacter sp.]|jgi:hypothetical protein|nr:lantibiotic dehydratase C-terminal domain-containing protein [Candidatus Angelobacter sp.]